MKKILVFLCAILLGFGIIGSTPAGAVSMQPAGLPLCGGSWYQGWDVPDSYGQIAKIEVFITYGDTDLGDPPLYGFNAAGWGSDLVNPDYGLATGTPAIGLELWTAFTADLSESFGIDVLFYTQNSFVGGDSYAWNGPGNYWIRAEQDLMIDSPEGYDRHNQFPVPEPATMLLLGSGLIGLAALGRKKLFKKS